MKWHNSPQKNMKLSSWAMLSLMLMGWCKQALFTCFVSCWERIELSQKIRYESCFRWGVCPPKTTKSRQKDSYRHKGSAPNPALPFREVRRDKNHSSSQETFLSFATKWFNWAQSHWLLYKYCQSFRFLLKFIRVRVTRSFWTVGGKKENGLTKLQLLIPPPSIVKEQIISLIYRIFI